MGVLHILVGHSGPETAADGRTHFGIFATQVWKLFPRGQTIQLNFWDYNDVARGLFRRRRNRGARTESGHHHHRSGAARLPGGRPQQIRGQGRQGRRQGPLCDPRLRPRQAPPRLCDRQGSSSTVNLVKALPKLEQAGINVKVISAISEELFDRQPEAYRNSVLPPEALLDAMVVSSGHAARLAGARPGAADRRLFADLGLGRSVADGRVGKGRDRRSASGSGVDLQGDRAVCAGS